MKKALFGLNIFLGSTLLFWPMMVLSSAMIFDAPGSEDNPLTRLIALWSITYPLPILVGGVGVWFNRKQEKNTRIVIFSLISLLSLGIGIVLFVLLEVFCDGQFACR